MKNVNRGAALPRKFAYGPTMTVVFDEDTARPAVNASHAKKIARIMDLLERQLSEPDHSESEVDPGRIWAAMVANTKQREVQAEQDRQAAQEAYMDRNPHKRGGDGGRFTIRKDGKFGYETPEDRVTVPAKVFEKQCADAAAAYAAKNPHKSKDKRPATVARDSSMSICEEVEAAYAARNPHKRGTV